MKKRYWKKVMVLGLTVSSALLFAGCGKGNEAAGTTAEQSSAANQATAEVAPESKTEESSAGIDGAAEKARSECRRTGTSGICRGTGIYEGTSERNDRTAGDRL